MTSGYTATTLPDPPRLLTRVRDKIRLKHYSIRTEHAYVDWIRRFITFHGKRHPTDLGPAEVESFLTDLAVAHGVVASTQNQAKSAILFLYKEVLGIELPWLDGIEKAKVPKRLPVVLTREETKRALEQLHDVHALIGRLLYGTSMRVMEGMRLHVKDMDFARREILIRDGKGYKGRVTVLPRARIVAARPARSRGGAASARSCGRVRCRLVTACARTKIPASRPGMGVAVRLSSGRTLARYAHRYCASSSSLRSGVSARDAAGCPRCRAHEARDSAHVAALCRPGNYAGLSPRSSCFRLFAGQLTRHSFMSSSHRRVEEKTWVLKHSLPFAAQSAASTKDRLDPTWMTMPHDYAALLLAQGYCRKAARSQLRCVAEFSRWLKRRKLSAEDIDGATIDGFLSAYHRRRRRACQGDLATLRRLRRLLIERGVVPGDGPHMSTGAVSLVEHDFDHYLIEERGLSSSTRDIYHDFVHQFLEERSAKGPIRLDSLSAAEVTDFVRRHARDFGSAHVRLLPTALRAFIRYLLHRGVITQDLSGCVPAVANWSCAPLPKSLGPGEVEQVLKRCTRETPVGRRDYAILLLLARLGLRGGEVAGLTLEDIDWEAGRLRLRSKCKRFDELPLPADVGEAIVDYLAHGRPASTSRRVFLRARAPYIGFRVTCAICDVVDRALTGAGVASARRGGHLFRHSLATAMLRAGASLTEIGQLFRHRNPDTTRIYAKVDVAALRRLATPWPGGGR